MRNQHTSMSLEQIAQQCLIEYGFTPFFDRAVSRHASRLKAFIPSKKDGIKDLRSLFWTSIDNEDSEDLDQLEYSERQLNGDVHIKIAIADVDEYVRVGDAIDQHASHNATSVYTGVANFPMLPEELSYGISSLLPYQDRLAIVVEYSVKTDGQIKYGNVYRAWVNNKAKLVYEQVGQWLNDPGTSPDWLTDEVEQQLHMQFQAAKKMRRWRQKEGMLEFETIESKPRIVNGKINDLVVQESTHAHKIIEQFMVAANQTVVNFLRQRNIPVIQRIVRTPERWGRIVEIAADFNVDLPPEPDPVALRKFLMLRFQKSPQTFADLSLLIIKLIGRGEYEVVNPGKQGHGHFGLAVGHYTHSTAPNRRYVDLITQRLIKAVVKNNPLPYDKRELVACAAWCTDRDTASKKVERYMRKVAAAILLQDRVGQEFEGIITGSSSKGVYVRLLDPAAEGRVMKNERGLDVGQRVRVRLLQVDPLKGYLDFQRLKLLR